MGAGSPRTRALSDADHPPRRTFARTWLPAAAHTPPAPTAGPPFAAEGVRVASSAVAAVALPAATPDDLAADRLVSHRRGGVGGPGLEVRGRGGGWLQAWFADPAADLPDSRRPRERLRRHSGASASGCRPCGPPRRRSARKALGCRVLEAGSHPCGLSARDAADLTTHRVRRFAPSGADVAAVGPVVTADTTAVREGLAAATRSGSCQCQRVPTRRIPTPAACRWRTVRGVGGLPRGRTAARAGHRRR